MPALSSLLETTPTPQTPPKPKPSKPKESKKKQKDSVVNSMNVFFWENRIFIKKQFPQIKNIFMKAQELWGQFDQNQKDIYKKIANKINSNPLPGVCTEDFDGIQAYKKAMGLPTVDDPEVAREFRVENDLDQKDQVPQLPNAADMRDDVTSAEMMEKVKNDLEMEESKE